MAGQPSAHAEIERVVDIRQPVIESAEGQPEAVPHQHAARGDREHVAQVVVLPLVELGVDDRHRRAHRGHGLAELVDARRITLVHLLGTGDRDGRRNLDRREQLG